MNFLQILAVLTSAIVGVWLVGVFLLGALHPKIKNGGLGNLIIGIPALALAIWLPMAFGWIGA